MGEPACLMRSFSEPMETSSYGANDVDPIRALTESVSFGRFMSEPLSWEKWSTFSHNRYLEEVDRFFKPGSVAQKKAFFEAHYKKRAAMKAQEMLENTAETANGITKAESRNGNQKDSNFDSKSGKMDTATDGEGQKDETHPIEKRAAMKAFLEAQCKKRTAMKAQEMLENAAETANGISEAKSGNGFQKDSIFNSESEKPIELNCAENDTLCCPSEITNVEQDQTLEQLEVHIKDSAASENDVKDTSFNSESEKVDMAIDGEDQRDDNQIELDYAVNANLCCPSSNEIINAEQDQTQEVHVEESVLSENDVNCLDKVKPEEMIIKERFSTSSSKGRRSSSLSVRRRTSEGSKNENLSPLNSKISQSASKRKPYLESSKVAYNSVSHSGETRKTLLKIPRKGPRNRNDATSLDNKNVIREEANMKKRPNPSSVHMSTRILSSSQTSKLSPKRPMNVSTTQVSATLKVKNHLLLNGKASIESSGRQNRPLPMNHGSHADGSAKTSVGTAKHDSDSARCSSTRPMNVSTARVSAISKIKNHSVLNGKASTESSGCQNRSLSMNLGSHGSAKTSVVTAKPDSDSAQIIKLSPKRPMNLSTTQVIAPSKVKNHVVLNGKESIRNSGSQIRSLRVPLYKSRSPGSDGSAKTSVETVKRGTDSSRCSSSRASVSGWSKLPPRNLPSRDKRPSESQSTLVREKILNQSGIKTRSSTVSSPFRFQSDERAAKRKEMAAMKVNSQHDKRSSNLSQSSSHNDRVSKPPKRSSVNVETLKDVESENRQHKIRTLASRPTRKAQENSPPNIRR